MVALTATSTLLFVKIKVLDDYGNQIFPSILHYICDRISEQCFYLVLAFAKKQGRNAPCFSGVTRWVYPRCCDMVCVEVYSQSPILFICDDRRFGPFSSGMYVPAFILSDKQVAYSLISQQRIVEYLLSVREH